MDLLTKNKFQINKLVKQSIRVQIQKDQNTFVNLSYFQNSYFSQVYFLKLESVKLLTKFTINGERVTSMHLETQLDAAPFQQWELEQRGPLKKATLKKFSTKKLFKNFSMKNLQKMLQKIKISKNLQKKKSSKHFMEDENL